MKKTKLIVIFFLIFALIVGCSNNVADREAEEKEENSMQLTTDSEKEHENGESNASEQLFDESKEYDEFSMYLAYYNKLMALQGEFGKTSTIVQTYESRLAGLCYAKLIDFNVDGKEELLLVYYDGIVDKNGNPEYVLEIWEYGDSVCQKIFEDINPSDEYYSPYLSVALETSEEMPYYVQISDSGGGYNYWGYEDGSFVIKRSNDSYNGKYWIDGEEVSEPDYLAYLNKKQFDFDQLCYLTADIADSQGYLGDTVSALQDTFGTLRQNIGLSEDEISVSLDSSDFKMLNNEEVAELARLYYETVCGYKPSIADVEDVEKTEDGEWKL